MSQKFDEQDESPSKKVLVIGGEKITAMAVSHHIMAQRQHLHEDQVILVGKDDIQKFHNELKIAAAKDLPDILSSLHSREIADKAISQLQEDFARNKSMYTPDMYNNRKGRRLKEKKSKDWLKRHKHLLK
jgi:hypothetical protein